MVYSKCAIQKHEMKTCEYLKPEEQKEEENASDRQATQELA